MKVVFHLGIHKTASSLFQKEVFPKIPDCSFLPRVKMEELKNYILYTDDFEFNGVFGKEIFNKILFENKINKNQTVIISDEEFYGNPYLGSIDRKRNLDRIIEIFGRNTLFILFLRNQQDLLDSLYNQYIKTGGTARFKEFVSYRKYPLIIQDNYFKFDKYLEYLLKETSFDNVKVYLYEDFRVNKDDVIKSIYEYLNINSIPKKLKLNKSVNSSLDNKVIGFMRLLNKFTKSPKEPFLLFNSKLHKGVRFLMLKVKFKKKMKRNLKPHDFFEEVKKSNARLKTTFDYLKLDKYNYPQ